MILKLVIAASTYGTNDIRHWGDFLAGVRTAGPVGVYGLHFVHSFYNHPPLIGYFLWVVNTFSDLGVPYNFTIRMVASLADVGSAFVIFELLRRRRGQVQATWAAVLVAVSPVLFLVSGFHGNTDPAFTFFAVLSLYLLVDRRAPALAGGVLALAVGVKVVPVVLLPLLLVYAWKRGARVAAGCAIGFAAVFALTWGPALLLQLRAVRQDVIGYSGTGRSGWGVMQIGAWLGDPGWVGWWAGPGRVVLVAVCALVPAIAVWRRPSAVLPAFAWSLIVFLTLATTFGVQYLVWPVVACYLVNVRLATIYSVTAGAILAGVYNRWAGGLPWNIADASLFTATERVFVLIPWLTLVLIAGQATWVMFARTTVQIGRTAQARP